MINSSKEISRDKKRRMKLNQLTINKFKIINKKIELEIQEVSMHLDLLKQGTVF